MKPLNTRNTQKDLLFQKESYAIRGAVFEVYREMGCGFLEAVYQECLVKELRLRNSFCFSSGSETDLQR